MCQAFHSPLDMSLSAAGHHWTCSALAVSDGHEAEMSIGQCMGRACPLAAGDQGGHVHCFVRRRACPLLRAEEGMFMGYQAGGRKCLPLMSRGGHVHSSVRRKGMSQGLGDRGEGMSTRRCQGRACPEGRARHGLPPSQTGPRRAPGGLPATGTAPAGCGGAGPGGLPWLPRRGGVR